MNKPTINSITLSFIFLIYSTIIICFLQFLSTNFPIDVSPMDLLSVEIFSNILDGGSSQSKYSSILGPLTNVSREEYYSAFQAELLVIDNVGDLVKDHITRATLQGPIFDKSFFCSTPAITDKEASIIMEANNIYIPKSLLLPKDLRDIEIVLAFTNRLDYNSLVNKLQADL